MESGDQSVVNKDNKVNIYPSNLQILLFYEHFSDLLGKQQAGKNKKGGNKYFKYKSEPIVLKYLSKVEDSLINSNNNDFKGKSKAQSKYSHIDLEENNNNFTYLELYELVKITNTKGPMADKIINAYENAKELIPIAPMGDIFNAEYNHIVDNHPSEDHYLEYNKLEKKLFAMDKKYQLKVNNIAKLRKQHKLRSLRSKALSGSLVNGRSM